MNRQSLAEKFLKHEVSPSNRLWFKIIFISVDENSPIGTLICIDQSDCRVTAKDPEGDEFALRLPDKKVPFAISTDGQLTVNGPLDREQKDEYQFDVIGKDSYYINHMHFFMGQKVKGLKA